jgi:hypothetical protein
LVINAHRLQYQREQIFDDDYKCIAVRQNRDFFFVIVLYERKTNKRFYVNAIVHFDDADKTVFGVRRSISLIILQGLFCLD